MPRISICLNIEKKKEPHFSGENDCLDFCRSCWRKGVARKIVASYTAPIPAVDEALTELANNPDGEEHPSYDEEGRYTCEGCGKKLTEKDD